MFGLVVPSFLIEIHKIHINYIFISTLDTIYHKKCKFASLLWKMYLSCILHLRNPTWSSLVTCIHGTYSPSLVISVSLVFCGTPVCMVTIFRTGCIYFASVFERKHATLSFCCDATWMGDLKYSRRSVIRTFDTTQS